MQPPTPPEEPTPQPGSPSPPSTPDLSTPPTPTLPPPPPINPETGRRADGRRGQPTKLTEDTANRITQVIRAGNYLNVAAKFAGIGDSTLRTWMARGRAAEATHQRGEDVDPEDERYRAFLAAVQQAETHAEVSAVTAWRSHFAEDWRASRDFLRAHHPDRWAPVQRVQLTTEEAEARTDRAVWEVLTSLGIDAPEPGQMDSDAADLLAELADDLPPETEEDD
jgi:hypothetical protein